MTLMAGAEPWDLVLYTDEEGPACTTKRRGPSSAREEAVSSSGEAGSCARLGGPNGTRRAEGPAACCSLEGAGEASAKAPHQLKIAKIDLLILPTLVLLMHRSNGN